MKTSEASSQAGHCQVEDYWALARRIANLGTQGVERLEFLRLVSADLLSFFGGSAILMWMTDFGHDYYWEMTRETSIEPRFRPTGEFRRASGSIEQRESLESRIRKFVHRLGGPEPDTTPNPWSITAPDADTIRRVFEAAAFDEEFSEAFRRIPSASILLHTIHASHDFLGLLVLSADAAGRICEGSAAVFEPVAQTLGRAIINRRAQFRLRERIKELTCLHGIAQICQRAGDSVKTRLQSMIDLLPPAMQFPAIASARLRVDDREYSTGSAAGSVHELHADIKVGGRTRGLVTVAYVQHHPEFAVGPFLPEEQELLNSVAHEIAMFLERAESDTAKSSLAEQLRHADRLATIGQLAAGVAHELNEPLGNIIGFAQLLQKHDGLPPGASRDAEQIVQAALHGREIVKKLLLFSRQSVARRVTLNLNDVIREGLLFLEARCRHGGIELRLALSDDLPLIAGVASEVTQVLVNLAVNAIQAMPDGGVLAVRTRAEGDTVIWTVEDNGAGMTPETQRRLFTPFFTTKDVGEGTGLGLSVVLGIVSSHGGVIHVESALGKGSRFEIRLPASAPGAGVVAVGDS